MNRLLVGISVVTIALFCGAPGCFAQSSAANSHGTAYEGLTFSGGQAGNGNRVALPLQTAKSLLVQSARLIGPREASSGMELTVSLKLRHVSRLKSFLNAVQNPDSPVYHEFLTPAEFTKLYGPTRAQVNKVESYLKKYGIQIKDVSRNRLLIHTTATTESYEHAFEIRVNDYSMGGRKFFSTEDRPRLPADIAGLVLNIIGLNNAVQLEPQHHIERLPFVLTSGTGAKASAAVQAPAPTTAYFNPHQVAVAYNWPSITQTGHGAGVTVAILTAQANGLASNDSYTTFWSAYGLPDHSVNIIPVDGNSSSSAGMVETLLDVEYCGAMAPGADLDVYVGVNANLSTFTDMYNQFVNDDSVQVMTTSWGSSEINHGSDGIATDEAIFMQGAAEGISMFAAAGDAGSSNGSSDPNMASYPSVSDYITSANGTELSIATITGVYGSEKAWDDTGGAISRLVEKPSWQTGPGVPSSDFRMNSDMAMNASPLHPYVLYLASQGWVGVDGTSAVAPQLAALFAIGVSQQPGGVSLGQSNSLIYDDVNAGNEASDFRDVTTGSNGAYDAGPNWDHPTGWGSPRGVALLSHLGIHGPSGTLQGSVTDAATGKPIKGALITIAPGDAGQYTEEDGSYSVPLAVGNYTVTVDEFGYIKQSNSISIGDGKTTDVDFSLHKAPNATLSGRVTDGSGHGYGLYARVTVSKSGFGTVGRTWTDPATGHYSLSLPGDSSYSLDVTPVFDGYDAGSGTAVLDGDTAMDFGLKVNSTCSAPGYAFVGRGFSQDFNGSFPPAGWRVTNAVGGSRVVWKSNRDWSDGNYTGGTGMAATVDSNRAGVGSGAYDTALISPPIPVTRLRASPLLRYRVNYQEFDSEQLDVAISVDGGDTWTNLSQLTASQGALYELPGASEQLDLGPYLPTSGSIRIRWRYHTPANGDDWYAQIDDVIIGSSACQPIPGGLVFGRVTDGDSDRGLLGATIAADTGAATLSTWNPSDANFPVGGYLFFVPSGAHTLTVKDGYYSSASDKLTVPDDKVITKDFSLLSGKLSVDSAQISANVMVNHQKTGTLTIHNSGDVAATFKILPFDAPLPSTAMAGTKMPPITLHGNYALSSTFDKGSANLSPPRFAGMEGQSVHWTDIASMPDSIYDNAGVLDPETGTVYSIDGEDNTVGIVNYVFAYDPVTDAWSEVANTPTRIQSPTAQYIKGRIYVANGWSDDSAASPSAQLAIYNPRNNTWTTGKENPNPAGGASASAVVNGKMYVVGGCIENCYKTVTTVEVYDPASDTWSSAAPYPVPVAYLACGGINGKLYCGGGTSSGIAHAQSYMYSPERDRWTPIASLPGTLWGMSYVVSGQELLVSGGVTNGNSTLTNGGYAYNPANNTWNPIPNANEALYRGAGACGFYRFGGTAGNQAPPAPLPGEKLSGYSECNPSPSIPYLEVAPASGTIAAGATAEITLTYDGTGQTPFTTSESYLGITGNTAYASPRVPVKVTWEPQSVDLKVSATASPNPLYLVDDGNSSSVLVYSVTVTNQKQAHHGSATGVTLTFPIPDNAAWVDQGGACQAQSAKVTCALGDMAAGDSTTLSVAFRIAKAGTIRETFTAAAKEPQDPAGDNVDKLAVSVVSASTKSSGEGGGGFGALALLCLLGLIVGDVLIRRM